MDVVIEGTGDGSLVFDAITATGAYGIVCLTGVSPVGRSLTVGAGSIDREVVLENDAIVGSVNGNARHCRLDADALATAHPAWLRRLLTRTVPLERAAEALDPAGADVKVVLTLGGLDY